MKVTDSTGQVPKPKLDFNQATDVLCEECHTGLFIQSYLIKHFSEVASPTGDAVHVPIPIFACAGCGHVNRAFFPKAARPAATVENAADIHTMIKP